MMAKKEREFQSELIKEIKARFPGAVVVKNDPSYIQGFPDLTVLCGKHWAALECKKSREASRRPNQPYYVEKLNEMSYARFICPDNREEVLDELQQTFGA